MGQIKLATASGGGVILSPDNTASDVTVSIPATTATMVTTAATQTLTNKTLTSPTLTTPNIDSAQFATVSGTAPIYPCRAWVNFNGTGTVAIRASGNVSSITDNGTGIYTVNFTTAMPDANYSNVYGGCEDLTSASVGYFVGTYTQSGTVQIKSTTQLQICMKNQQGNAADATDISVSIFR